MRNCESQGEKAKHLVPHSQSSSSSLHFPSLVKTNNKNSLIMNPVPDLPVPPLPSLRLKPSSSSSSAAAVTPSATPTSGAQRRIAIAVDLSEESAYAVKWAVNNYLRPGDAVILLHVRPTSVLYGADWGFVSPTPTPNATSTTPPPTQEQLEDDFDSFTSNKASSLARPLLDADIPFKIHIVKDHDMKERLCLEVERLGLSAVIMGSRGFGAAARRSGKGRLGSVSDYCVHHCVCPVVVVRDPNVNGTDDAESIRNDGINDVAALHPVPEEDQEEEYHDASDEQKGA